VAQFLSDFCAAAQREQLELAPDAEAWLHGREFRGNVRELRNLMQRVAVLAAGPVIDLPELQQLAGEASPSGPASGTLASELEALERRMIRDAVTAADGNLAAAARALGVDRANLHRRMKRLELGRA